MDNTTNTQTERTVEELISDYKNQLSGSNEPQAEAQEVQAEQPVQPQEEVKPEEAKVNEGETEENKSEEVKSETPEASKSQKEDVRRDRSWKSYQEKMEAFKKEQEEWKKTVEAKTAEAERIRAEAEAYANQKRKEAEEASLKKDTEFTPEFLLEYADKFEQAGDLEKAKFLRGQARIAAQKQAEYAALQERKRAEGMQKEAQTWMQKVEQEYPEIKDQSSELFKITKDVYSKNGDLRNMPRGLYLATSYAKAKLEASRVPELLKQTEALQKELEQTKKKLTAPVSSTSASAAQSQAPKKEMTLEEMVETHKKLVGASA